MEKTPTEMVKCTFSTLQTKLGNSYTIWTSWESLTRASICPHPTRTRSMWLAVTTKWAARYTILKKTNGALSALTIHCWVTRSIHSQVPWRYHLLLSLEISPYYRGLPEVLHNRLGDLSNETTNNSSNNKHNEKRYSTRFHDTRLSLEKWLIVIWI